MVLATLAAGDIVEDGDELPDGLAALALPDNSNACLAYGGEAPAARRFI